MSAADGLAATPVCFDHLVHWVPDLDAAVAQCRGLGFPVRYGVRHLGRGTHNAGFRAGAGAVELLAVRDRAEARTARAAEWPRIAAALAAGGGALRFAIGVPDVAATLAHLRARGVGVDEVTLYARRADGRTDTRALLFLREGPAWRPFFVQRRPPPREASPAMASSRLDHLVLETADPWAGACWLSRLLGLPVPARAGPAYAVGVPACPVVATRGPAERITEVVLRGDHAPVGEVANLRYARREEGVNP